jgi:hypothetical protein
LSNFDTTYSLVLYSVHMARTDKWEHRSDGFHIWHRLERQARPAGRDAQVFEADLALDEEES